jgi:fermentation-respiration switch protein FrsA (DUF1100 family)
MFAMFAGAGHAMTPSFIHLNLHSEYSLVDGLVRIQPLMEKAAAAGMPAVAITDHVNLFALVKFFTAARNAGIKPVAGVDLALDQGDGEHFSRLTLLCQNLDGYRNLTRLVSRLARVVPVDPMKDPSALPFAPQTFAGAIVDTPVLLQMGRADPLYSAADAQQLHDLIPDERKELVWYDSGHRLPPEYARAAVGWLREHLGGGEIRTP